MTLENLPQTTTDIAIDALIRKVDVGHASGWAVDLIALGHLDPDTVELAGLDRTEGRRAGELLPKVAKVVGLDLEDRQLLFRWVERHFLRNFLTGVLSEMDLIDCGYAVWARLIAFNDDLPNPFQIYNDLGDLISIETDGRDLESLARPDRRGWVLGHLVEDGAFERAGLPNP